ncbi:MAG: biopolymer transporter ExbD [Pseudooceanicola sp.]|jgi:biopolymer transport protein ExbD|nr:biopolymer transporter ExbD [Pseudooceanicola sp.]|tara:strand:+ start:52 stop:474 length:423 start_codon:yes stop_codon:yes gene_type:complete
MARPVALTRPARAGPLISLVPMIDVMLILLVFFMVTSTYLNLDMIPAVQQQNSAASGPAPKGTTVMIRLGAGGDPVVSGQPVAMGDLAAVLRARLAGDPDLRVLILPSGAARTQALISVMDAATAAGVQQLQVIRLEAQP